MNLEQFYNKNYKKLFLIPIILLVISLGIIFNHYQKTGDIVDKDVSLKGGLSTEIYSDKPILESSYNNLESQLKIKFTNKDYFIRKLVDFSSSELTGLIIESSDLKETDIKPIVESTIDIKLIPDKNYFVRETSSTLGKSFYNQMLTTILLAFAFMTVVVLIIYRKLVPSFAIILAPILNMVNAIAVIDLMGFRISDATVAALLLMIGYSVDTDILLSTKVLKRKEGTVFERMYSSFTTGLVMTAAAVVALLFAYLSTNSFVLKEMFIVLIIGLSSDVISTYLMNAGMLRWYLKNES